ncbi:exosortase B [Sideroxydans sp. CL21]|uniref:exosortase B n=1 Tax=Sideroxydans sp. CL21 TaxID=2600596 RepID=UPI0024BD22D4|nr:exosortase B [Sideroxydans sp. CL21]
MTTLSKPMPDVMWKSSWPILLGLCVLYLPTIYTFAKTVWQSEDQAHAPIILMAVTFIFWQKRDYLIGETQQKLNPVIGWMMLLFGLLLYVIGRTQGVRLFEIGSLVPVLIGSLLITRGTATIKKLWFPLLYLLFVIPLPGALVDALTGPLKQQISELVEMLLYWAGYPIARSGVTLSIGPYQLLVADACSGLNSMFSLSAMGLLYLYIMRYRSWVRNGVMIASLLPIAFFANTLRVIILVLITYHFGDEVGQGFIHKFAGVLLFFASLVLLFLLDVFLGWILPKYTKAESR